MMIIVCFEKGRRGDPVARMEDGSLGLLDRRHPIADGPRPGEYWHCKLAGRSKDGRLTFLRPVRRATWEEYLAQVAGRGGSKAAEAAQGAETAKTAEAAAEIGAEVDRIIALIQAGPETPAPEAPVEPTVSCPTWTEIFSTRDGQDAIVVSYFPGDDRPWMVTTTIRRPPKVRFALSEPEELVVRRSSLEEVDEWFEGHLPRVREAWRAARPEASRQAARLDVAYAEAKAAREQYEAAMAQWRKAIQTWRAASERNRFFELAQNGWLEIREWNGRPWLWIVLGEDLVPVQSLGQIKTL